MVYTDLSVEKSVMPTLEELLRKVLFFKLPSIHHRTHSQFVLHYCIKFFELFLLSLVGLFTLDFCFVSLITLLRVKQFSDSCKQEISVGINSLGPFSSACEEAVCVFLSVVCLYCLN